MKKKGNILNTENKRAAIYIRMSTDAQKEEGYSIEEQRDSLERYCKTLQIKSHELYIDDGFTGNDMDRPELQRLISNVKKKNINVVLVYKLDRLSRNQKDMLYLIEDIFNSNGVAFISLKEQFDTSSATGRSMIGILSTFAQSESKNIYEKTRIGMKERVKQGYWMGGGRIPFGYDYSKEKKILIPNQDADTVRRIYDLYLQGYSADKIAQMVGLKYDRLVVQILTRKTNCGYITYNGVEYKGKHEAIVSEETYYKAMDYMKMRSIRRVGESSYLLTGLLVCGKCNAKMRYQKWGKNDAKIVCYSQYASKPYLVKDPNCDNIKLWASEIEAAVIQDLFSFSLLFKDTNFDDSPGMSNVSDMLQNQYESQNKQLTRLREVYSESKDKILLESIEDIKNKLSNTQKQIQVESQRSAVTNQVASIKKMLSTIKEAWEDMTIEEKKYAVERCIEKVVITGDKVDIFYKFKILDDEKIKEN